jgi:hypothetical protein
MRKTDKTSACLSRIACFKSSFIFSASFGIILFTFF